MLEPAGYFDVYQGKDGTPSYVQIKPELADKTSVPLYTLPDLLAALREVTPEMMLEGTTQIDLDECGELDSEFHQRVCRHIFEAMLYAFERQMEGEK